MKTSVNLTTTDRLLQAFTAQLEVEMHDIARRITAEAEEKLRQEIKRATVDAAAKFCSQINMRDFGNRVEFSVDFSKLEKST